MTKSLPLQFYFCTYFVT